MSIQIVHNPELARYEAHVGGTLAGFAEYRLTTGLITFTHTEVDPSFEGQGVGSAIVRFALDEVRAEGTRRVVPLCPFFKRWIHRHADYRPLVYSARATSPED